MKPRLLDLFCGAGGAGSGYARAGFDVVGVDLSPQKRYPFTFELFDAVAYLDGLLDGSLGMTFDAVHASPPCQRFSTLTKMHGRTRVETHVDLIAPVRERLKALGLPYVIENVPGAPLVEPVMLCGTMFGLGAAGMHLRRHRLFESNVELWPPASCAHVGQAIGIYGHPGGTSTRDRRGFGSTADWRQALDVDYMTVDEMAESIPPAYTEHIGKALLAAVGSRAA